MLLLKFVPNSAIILVALDAVFAILNHVDIVIAFVPERSILADEDNEDDKTLSNLNALPTALLVTDPVLAVRLNEDDA